MPSRKIFRPQNCGAVAHALPRQVEWRMIPDYRDFTIGSIFSGTDQSPTRSALLTANWRGYETAWEPPGARIAQRVVFGSDYEDGQRVHSSAPSSACARPDRPSGFSRPPVRVFQTARLGFPDRPSGFSRPPVRVFKVPRARPEPFPNAAEIGRDIEFSRS